MRTCQLLFFILCFAQSCLGQAFQWARLFGGPGRTQAMGYAIAGHPSGVLYVGGNFEKNADFDSFHLESSGVRGGFIAQLDTNGSVKWVRQLQTKVHVTVERIVVSPDGTLYACGRFADTLTIGDSVFAAPPPTSKGILLSTSGFIAKMDSLGNFLWVRQYSQSVETNNLGHAVLIRQSEAAALATDQQNRLYIASNQYYIGYRADSSLFSRQVGCIVQQFDPEGHLITEWPISTSDMTQVIHMAVDSKQQIYLAGIFIDESTVGNQHFTANGNTHVNAFVAKFTFEGSPLLAFSLHFDPLNPNLSNVGGIAVDSAENFYVSGNFDNHSLAKYNAAGRWQWRRNIQREPNGERWVTRPFIQKENIYLSGIADGQLRVGPIDLPNSLHAQRLFLVKYDSTGHEVWAVQGRSADYSQGHSAALNLTGDGDKSIFLVGRAGSKPRFDSLVPTGPGISNALVVKVRDNPLEKPADPNQGGNPGETTPPISLNLGPDSTLCEGESLIIKSTSEFISYRWQDGTTDSTFPVKEAGVYWLTVRDRFGQTASDTVHIQACVPLWIPNVITPNGDAHNEKWVIKNLSPRHGNRVLVYDRWGREVFVSGNYHNEWDAQGLENGLYFYVLQEEGKNGKSHKGWVQVIR